jgi:hypothetical protein
MKEFNEKELKVIQEQQLQTGDTMKIRIVSYNNAAPKLEKRQFFYKDGVINFSKAVGFNYEDFQFLKEKWEEIDEAFTTFEIKHGYKKNRPNAQD